HFTSSDGQGSFPGDYPFVAGDAGIHVFNAGVILDTAGDQSVTVTDPGAISLSSTATITVSPSTATHFLLSAPGSSTAGTAFPISLTALDRFNNVATGYTGTVALTSSDSQAVLSPATTLTGGTGTFSVTLKTAGNQG